MSSPKPDPNRLRGRPISVHRSSIRPVPILRGPPSTILPPAPEGWRDRLADTIEKIGGRLCQWCFTLADWVRR
jgi:hypothetical protein